MGENLLWMEYKMQASISFVFIFVYLMSFWKSLASIIARLNENLFSSWRWMDGVAKLGRVQHCLWTGLNFTDFPKSQLIYETKHKGSYVTFLALVCPPPLPLETFFSLFWLLILKCNFLQTAKEIRKKVSFGT